MIFSCVVGLIRSSALSRCWASRGWAEWIWRGECGGLALSFVTFKAELKITVVLLAWESGCRHGTRSREEIYAGIEALWWFGCAACLARDLVWWV